MQLQAASRTVWGSGRAALLATTAWIGIGGAAQAVVVELKDVAPDRIERQRAEAIGQIPLPNTPNIGRLADRLAEKSLVVGSAVMIRVFKAESELELWMQRGDKFELFATYPVCHWSGTLGPKVTEGDKQSPEGIYTVSARQLHLIGRHPRSLNLGFPNALDRQFSRTGSYILIHGGCGSVGCFAMTNPVIEEIFSLTQAAIKNGQDAVQVHAFPFRLTEAKLQSFALNEWYDYWRNLKDAYDSFERTRRPPKVTVCEGRYWVDDTLAPGEVASQGPLAVCGVSLAAVELPNSATDNASMTSPATLSPRAEFLNPPPRVLPVFRSPSFPSQRLSGERMLPQRRAPIGLPSNASSSSEPPQPFGSSRAGLSGKSSSLQNRPASSTTIARVQISCELTRPSCRRWADLQQVMAARAAAVARVNDSRRLRLASAKR